MGFIRKNIGFLIWLLLPAYFLILRNAIRNRHCHVLPNGLVIYHSHPVQDDGTPKPFSHHKHTKSEIFFFQNFNVHFHNVSTGIFFNVPVSLEREILTVQIETFHPSFTYTYPDLRAPPYKVI